MSLDEFRTIGKGIAIYKADLKESNRSDGLPSQKTTGHQPSLVIICTWLGGATSKRIQKYSRGYNMLWPKADILLIRTDPMEYAFCRARSLSRKLLPASGEIRKLIEAYTECPGPSPLSSRSSSGSNGPGILMHIFSNGGANIATQLVTSINNTLALIGEPSPLELRQVVFDSCPGDPGTNATYRAASQSLPRSHLLRPLGCAVLYLVVAGIAGLEAVGIRKRLGRTMRAQFNDPAVFDKVARRLYLTSIADRMVDAGDVQAHRDQALARGLKAELVAFERAGHCALILEDEAVYWGAIAGCWERSGYQNPASSCMEDDRSTRHGQLGYSKLTHNTSTHQGRSRL